MKHKRPPSREEQRVMSQLAHDFLGAIHEAKSNANMTNETFAAKLGVSAQHISTTFSECGNLTLRTLVTWANALDLEPVITLRLKGSGK